MTSTPPDDPGPILDPVEPAAEKPWEKPSARNRRIIAAAWMTGIALFASRCARSSFPALVPSRNLLTKKA